MSGDLDHAVALMREARAAVRDEYGWARTVELGLLLAQRSDAGRGDVDAALALLGEAQRYWDGAPASDKACCSRRLGSTEDGSPPFMRLCGTVGCAAAVRGMLAAERRERGRCCFPR